MIERVVAIAAACAVLTLSGKPAAEVPPQIAFRLDYQANLPGRGCPNADEFGLILAGEFGYLLVRDDAAATLRIETRTNGRGIEAELSAPNPAGEGEWRRVITSQDCRELVYDAATLIRIRFGPGGWEGEEPPPWLLAPPRFEVELPELRMEMPPAFLDSMAGEPSEAPLTPWEGTAPLWAQRAPAAEEKTPFQVEAALGAALTPYGLPSVALGGNLFAQARWARFAIGGDIRAVTTLSSDIGDGDLQGRVSLYTFAVLPCVVTRHIDFCAIGSGSLMRFDLEAPAALQRADASSAGFGLRLAPRLALSSVFSLVGYVDGTIETRKINLRTSGSNEPGVLPPPDWISPNIRLSLGIALSANLLQ
ncbi:hypothetical protein [Polyangium jinanense]|uniref:Uncharacterized protein n=1 Tax=Polyangium jinanense TaxID=2829994 RepID=A0A9X4ARK6_9BACT|nr:hypothetical protein [Polyangium jinanense]MDC3980165.1 hypothetical protein [Polyangium jinanense]